MILEKEMIELGVALVLLKLCNVINLALFFRALVN